jgi:hypothetical protein
LDNIPSRKSSFTATKCNTRVLKFFNPENSKGNTKQQFCRCRYIRESVSDNRANENLYGSISKPISVSSIWRENSSSICLTRLFYYRTTLLKIIYQTTTVFLLCTKLPSFCYD